MKKMLFLLFIFPLLVACSKDDDKKPEQDYTSFTFVYYSDVELFPNCVIGYKVGGQYKKLAELGDLKKNIPSKEVKVYDDSIQELYLFSDYLASMISEGIKFDDVYNLKKNTLNVFEIKEGTRGVSITEKSDSTQYPQ